MDEMAYFFASYLRFDEARLMSKTAGNSVYNKSEAELEDLGLSPNSAESLHHKISQHKQKECDEWRIRHAIKVLRSEPAWSDAVLDYHNWDIERVQSLPVEHATLDEVSAMQARALSYLESIRRGNCRTEEECIKQFFYQVIAPMVDATVIPAWEPSGEGYHIDTSSDTAWNSVVLLQTKFDPTFVEGLKQAAAYIVKKHLIGKFPLMTLCYDETGPVDLVEYPRFCVQRAMCTPNGTRGVLLEVEDKRFRYRGTKPCLSGEQKRMNNMFVGAIKNFLSSPSLVRVDQKLLFEQRRQLLHYGGLSCYSCRAPLRPQKISLP